MVTLIIATRNAHKISEIQSLMGDGFHCQSLAEFDDVPDPLEDGDNFAANANIKASVIALWISNKYSGRFTDPDTYVLADDSGLEVDALDGAPGLHSARFAALDTGGEGNSSDADNNAKLLRLLADVPAASCTARFRCSLVLMSLPHIGTHHATVFAEGVCEGRINKASQGDGGFGYDPLFIPEGYDRSFGELEEDIKNRFSHRAKAVERLKAFFDKR